MLGKKTMNLFIIIFMCVGLICAVFQSTEVKAYGATDQAFESQLDAQGFPESYKTYLRKLHEEHPNWTFTAKNLDYTWEEALAAQYKNANANLIPTIFPDAFKAVKSGTYNFTTHSYIGKDGSSWVSASKAAVAYYMDPRNWLSEEYVFQFENLKYNSSYQTANIVSKILATTAMPPEASAYYIAAAQQNMYGFDNSISPVYLAAKTRLELGTSDFMINGHTFTYGGKTYTGFYNAFNIGASDSADGSAATKGLVYAAGGADGSGTTYARPWDTLEKAIKGGALYIAEGFINNNQNTLYTQRYNVANGIENIGTHQYATDVINSASQASIISKNYDSFGVLDEAFDFQIPVYKAMPSTVCPRPASSGNNNCYLDSIVVSGDGVNYTYTPEFNRFTSTYTISQVLPSSVTKVTLAIEKNDETAKVTISGDSIKTGENKITVKCTSSAGVISKYYYIKLTREAPKVYIPEDVKDVAAENTGGTNVKLTWTGDPEATGYRIRYKRSSSSKWYYTETTSTTLTKKMATSGTMYDFKIRAFYKDGGEKTYSPNYTSTVRAATFGETTTLTGSLSSGYMSVKINWADIKGADGYLVNYKEKNSQEWLSAESEISEFKEKMANAGKGYEFKVTAYKNFDGEKYINGAQSNTKTVYTLKKTQVTLENKYTRSVKVKWVNISGETGYEIYRSTKENSGFTRLIKASGKYSSWVNTGLTVGETYYYKIRPYRNTAPGVYVYGPYSEVVSIER